MRNTLSLLLLGALGCTAATEPTTVPDTTSTTGAEVAPAHDIAGEEVTYQSGGVTLRGYLAWDRMRADKRPGVIVVHEWWGHNDYVRGRARMLAEMGYTALAIDMYGDGKNTTHPADAKQFMTEALANAEVAKARFEAGLAFLRAHASTDPVRTAAIGYCFGGAVVLGMARAGVDLDVVASFHGILGTATPAQPGAIAARVLVATGGADPMVPAEQVAAFEQEMTMAGARYEVVNYAAALHAFTNPEATARGKEHGLPLAYDAAADTDSWKRLGDLLQATFAAPEPTTEEKAKAAEGAKNRGELARMEAEAKQANARWTESLRAEAKALADTEHASTAAALKKILASGHRAPGHAERDKYRHADKTLAFFGLKPDMTVFEYGPGEGWYTEVLAPLLAARGKLIVNSGDPAGPAEVRDTFYSKRLKLFLDAAPEVYGKVQVVRVTDPAQPALGLDATLDMVVVMRGYHGWVRRGSSAAWLAELHKALKPGGVLGIEQHRAAEGVDMQAVAEKGWLPQKALIAEVEAAGFKLVGKSEINANRKDTKDYPTGVWALPPTLRLGDQDREKYLAIGESDRMTLKFVKRPAKAAAATETPGTKQ